jgi:hypothetical protein
VFSGPSLTSAGHRQLLQILFRSGQLFEEGMAGGKIFRQHTLIFDQLLSFATACHSTPNNSLIRLS